MKHVDMCLHDLIFLILKEIDRWDETDLLFLIDQ